MTIKELKDALTNLGAGHDNMEVKVWLPGTTISLGKSLFIRKGGWVIEGNVDKGSAIDRALSDTSVYL